MTRSLFVSYVFEDKRHFDLVSNWAREGLLGSNITATGETRDIRQQGETAVRNHLRPRIEGSSAILLLVGQNTHNHDWVKYELQVAISFNKKIIAARIPGTTGPIPSGLPTMSVIALNPSALRSALS